jgi:predicted DNA-binding protein with PD1-like motif
VKYSEAKQGRTFVIRLEDGDVLHEVIEQFAFERAIGAAALIAVGGADDGSRLVVGPAKGRAKPLVPVEHTLDGVHEIAGTGTLFRNEQGQPILHMHMACGRGDRSITGCARTGVKTWHVMEVVLFEITGTTARRTLDPETGFTLLQP